MSSNFDLNLPFIVNESEFLFDLNQTPIDEDVDVFHNEDDDVAMVTDQVDSNNFSSEEDPGIFLSYMDLFSHFFCSNYCTLVFVLLLTVMFAISLCTCLICFMHVYFDIFLFFDRII